MLKRNAYILVFINYYDIKNKIFNLDFSSAVVVSAVKIITLWYT